MSKRDSWDGKKKWWNLLVQVKSNQKNLHLECEEICTKSNFEDSDTDIDQWHGRIEKREVEIYENRLNGFWREEMEMVIRVIRTRHKLDTKSKKWKKSTEISYYVSTICLDAKIVQKIIRDHWSIENCNHRVRDETLKEDSSRIRTNPQNMSKLRWIALNVLRKNNIKNIENELYKNALDFNNIVCNYKCVL